MTFFLIRTPISNYPVGEVVEEDFPAEEAEVKHLLGPPQWFRVAHTQAPTLSESFLQLNLKKNRRIFSPFNLPLSFSRFALLETIIKPKRK